jgi:uncharacterized membrane protein YedE/YeeE
MASATTDVVAPAGERSREAQAPMNPYAAGVGLGLVLLATFVLMGRGLGATGAFGSTVAWLASLTAPAWAQSNEFLARYLPEEGHPLRAWLVFEVAGVAIGAVLSAVLAGRIGVAVEKGPRVPVRSRLLLAFAGGALMAAGAALARGCTSGQALTGGSLLNLGSWIFLGCVFAGGYAVAPFLRRLWR